MKLRNLFKSGAHRQLEACLEAYYKCRQDSSQSSRLKYDAIEAVIAAYDETAAQKISAHRDTTEDQKAILNLFGCAQQARQELLSPSPRESYFMTAFINILDQRRADVSGGIFGLANNLARILSESDQSTGSSTLLQTKALEMLANRYFEYADKLGGYNGDGGPAGCSNFRAGVNAAFNAAHGYRKHGCPEERRRAYKKIYEEVCSNDANLTETAEQEVSTELGIKPEDWGKQLSL